VAIILASCINKAPVIRNILKSKNVVGLSMAASYGEVILYSNAAFYNILQGNPFTAYGETFMVLIQNMLVVTLIWTYTKNGFGMANIALVLAAYCAYLYIVFGGE
jgi:mannose-P-dolichol utilization defect protein 1